MARHTWGRGGERLFLIRHCEAAGQDATARLTAAGHAQAIRLADQVAALIR